MDHIADETNVLGVIMTLNQKRIFKEIRRIRKEPVVVLVSGFFLFILLAFITFVALISENRRIDSVVVVMMMGGIYILLLIFILVVRYSRDSRFIKTLSETNAARVLDEISDGKRFSSLQAMITRNFLINLQVGMYAIPIDDILLMYLKQHSVNYIPTQLELIVKTRSAQEFSIASCSYFSRKNKKRQLELVKILHEKNPGIMFGFTNENLYAYQKETVRTRD